MTWMKMFLVVVVAAITANITLIEASAVDAPPQPAANDVTPHEANATESKDADASKPKGANSTESKDANSTELDCEGDYLNHRRPIYGLCVHDFMEIELCLDFAKKLYELQTLKHASHMMQNYFMCEDDDEDDDDDEHPFPIHVRIYCPATQAPGNAEKSSENGPNKSEVDASEKEGGKTYPGFFAERQENGDVELQNICNLKPMATVPEKDIPNLHPSDDSKQNDAENVAAPNNADDAGSKAEPEKVDEEKTETQ